MLESAERPVPDGARPHVVLIVGVNGTGKTTTVGKLANLLKAAGTGAAHLRRRHVSRRGRRATGDLGRRAPGVDMIKAQAGADPAAVVFDAISAGQGAAARRRAGGHRRPAAHARQPDGRTREDPAHRGPRGPRGAARGAAGARRHGRPERGRAGPGVHGRAGVTGIVLTKLDGTAKGGVAVAIAHDLKLPDPLRRHRRGHRRPRPVLARASTWTRCSRRRGERLRRRRAHPRRRVHAAGAAAGRAGPRHDQPQPDGRLRHRVGRRHRGRAAATTSGRAGRTPRSSRCAQAGARARRGHAVRHARTVLPHGPHRARASCRSPRPASRAWWPRWQDPNPHGRGPGARVPARAGSRRRACGVREAEAAGAQRGVRDGHDPRASASCC